MARIHHGTLTAIIACLCSSKAASQSLETFDFGRFYGDFAAINASTPNERPSQLAAYDVSTLNILEPVKRAADKQTNANYYSLYFDANGELLVTGTGHHLEENRTETVPSEGTFTDLPSLCGPSPASVDDIEVLVRRTAASYGVDASFALAITWAESRFDRLRNSQKGARGPMQLMPGTARRFEVENVCDPASNIDGGMRYLRALLDEFKNPLIAAAAYNAGEQAVYDFGGIPPYPETVRYVASVFNRQLGIALPPEHPNGSKKPVVTPADGEIKGTQMPAFVGGVMQF